MNRIIQILLGIERVHQKTHEAIRMMATKLLKKLYKLF